MQLVKLAPPSYNFEIFVNCLESVTEGASPSPHYWNVSVVSHQAQYMYTFLNGLSYKCWDVMTILYTLTVLLRPSSCTHQIFDRWFNMPNGSQTWTCPPFSCKETRWRARYEDSKSTSGYRVRSTIFTNDDLGNVSQSAQTSLLTKLRSRYISYIKPIPRSQFAFHSRDNTAMRI